MTDEVVRGFKELTEEQMRAILYHLPILCGRNRAKAAIKHLSTIAPILAHPGNCEKPVHLHSRFRRCQGCTLADGQVAYISRTGNLGRSAYVSPHFSRRSLIVRSEHNTTTI